ncbi:HalOD1 output domain-containing protein [Halorubrum sp. N11]|uniref:HalOD1 output domain-containing protein n=1 Tax=Halorubrum sp. N11 TaxID=3402276 RepID=UPI003EC1436D
MTADLDDDLCWDIVTAIAEERDIDRRDIEDRLYDIIDPHALGRLAQQSGASDDLSLSVSFRMADCYVTVTDGGQVRANHPV